MEEENKTPKHNPQRKMWEDCGIFATYAEAKAKSDSLESESKVRRCAPAGTRFKVKRVKKLLEAK
ncbi:MAG: hypothetical protein CL429_04770 [Acidimicrobiaceae bacterium]|nr:hypothetical protein [Acidimicrobiaceae bacterium]|tara:strand:+ start:416 stop:610 length:195 start_codon:yes stop_codon:yes gene_type:complete